MRLLRLILNVHSHIQMGKIHETVGSNSEAIKAFSMAVNISPNNEKYLLNLGNILSRNFSSEVRV